MQVKRLCCDYSDRFARAGPSRIIRAMSATKNNFDSATSASVINFSKIRGVLFDIDGTLCNSDPLHFLAFQSTLVEAGYDDGKPISEDFFRRRISGRHNPEIAADLFPQWSEDQRVCYYEGKEARFRQMASSGDLVPLAGLMDFLAWVDMRSLRRAAVTNAPKANTQLMLKALALDQYFEAVVLGEECVRAKPFPDPYLEGMRLLGLDPEETLIVEDSPAGIRAGVAAGVPVIGFTTGQSRETLEAAGATHVCQDFRDVLAMIRAQDRLG